MLNESAARSLAEGLDETLTLHPLGIVGELGRKSNSDREDRSVAGERSETAVAGERVAGHRAAAAPSAFYRALPKLREALQRI